MHPTGEQHVFRRTPLVEGKCIVDIADGTKLLQCHLCDFDTFCTDELDALTKLAEHLVGTHKKRVEAN